MTEHDITQVVDMVYDVVAQAAYTYGTSSLSPTAMSSAMFRSITTPEHMPTFIHEMPNGKLSGMLFGVVDDTMFTGERWFYERVFYIRPEYRTYARARAYIATAIEWCRENDVALVEMGNGVTLDSRLDKLYGRMGFRKVNTLHAKRI